MPMMSVMPFLEPSTTPVCSEVNSSGHGIGVGEAPSALTSSCGRSATTVRILSPSRSAGVATRRLVLAKLRQPPVLPMVISRIVPPEFSSTMSCMVSVNSVPFCSTASAIAVVGHQVGQVEHLDEGKDARRAAGGGDVDVDRAVGDALQAFRTVGAELGADEQLDLDRAVARPARRSS